MAVRGWVRVDRRLGGVSSAAEELIRGTANRENTMLPLQSLFWLALIILLRFSQLDYPNVVILTIWELIFLAGLAAPMCYEMDFPTFIHQVGQSEADALLVPSNDFLLIKKLHHVIPVFIVIKNWLPMLQTLCWGLSLAVIPLGIHWRSWIISLPKQLMTAHLPPPRSRTPYARIGDLFTWSCAVREFAILI
jgi:apolipoprotein N-acyltransferase